MIYKVIIEDEKRENSKTYDIDIVELRKKDDIYDTLHIDNNGIVTITRRIGYYKGETYILLEEKEEKYKNTYITFFKGKNYIHLENDNNTFMHIQYILENDFSNTYATKSEVSSSIRLESDSILNKVSMTYITNEDFEEKTNTIEAKIELKLNTKDLISEINASADIIRLKSGRLVIESGNFKLDEDGNVTCTDGNFQGDIRINYDNFLMAVDEDNNKYMTFNAGGLGFFQDNVETNCIARTMMDDGYGIALKATKSDSHISITYNNTSKFLYSAADDKIYIFSIPSISGTADGKLFQDAGGGITVNNGLITGWNLNGATGNLSLKDSAGSATVTVTVKDGLITGWSVS